MLAAGLAVATAVSAWPYWSLTLVLAASWLLRTCTLTVTAHGDRRRLRGARWYDVLVAPLSAPWYLVAAVPGALLLGAWALGVGLAGLLLCYAAGFSTAATLLRRRCSASRPGSGSDRVARTSAGRSASSRTRWPGVPDGGP